jgi:hypothetical protein
MCVEDQTSTVRMERRFQSGAKLCRELEQDTLPVCLPLAIVLTAIAGFRPRVEAVDAFTPGARETGLAVADADLARSYTLVACTGLSVCPG